MCGTRPGDGYFEVPARRSDRTRGTIDLRRLNDTKRDTDSDDIYDRADRRRNARPGPM